MTIKLERDYITAQLAAVERMLATMPAHDYIGRIGFEAKRDELQKQLAEFADLTGTRAQVVIYFGGEPVIGSVGIEAEFGSRAIGSFQALLTSVWGNLDGGHLQNMGPIKDKDSSQLHITSLVHGSFGFLLEELDQRADPMFQTPLSKAADQVAEYISSFAGENEATFSDVIDSLNPRVFQSMRSFIAQIHKSNATFRLVEGERDQQYDKFAIERAWNRAEASDVAEDRVELTGTLLGVIPMGRRFEFVPDTTGSVVKGRVGERFSNTYLENLQTQNPTGKRALALFHKRTVTKIGKEPTDAYTLLELHDLPSKI